MRGKVKGLSTDNNNDNNNDAGGMTCGNLFPDEIKTDIHRDHTGWLKLCYCDHLQTPPN